MLSDITAVPMPLMPNSFHEFSQHDSFDIIDTYFSSMNLILRKTGGMKFRGERIQDIDTKNKCAIKNIAQFLLHLINFSVESRCSVYFKLDSKMEHVRSLEKFGMIYKKSRKYIRNAICRTESRLIFHNTMEPLTARLYVFKTLLRTVFNQVFEDDFAILEASGIFQNYVNCAIQSTQMKALDLLQPFCANNMDQVLTNSFKICIVLNSEK